MNETSTWSVPPDPRLANPVAAIAGSRDGHGAPAPVRVVPDGLASLLVSAPIDAPHDLVEVAVYGFKTRALTVLSPTRVVNVAVQIRASHIGTLFGTDAAALTDRSVPLRELWGGAADRVLRDLAGAPDFTARKRILERALLERHSAPADAGRCLAAEGVRAIEATGGRIRVSALARQLDCSERRLLRVFRHHIGVSPKAFAGVARFRAAWADLARGELQVTVAAQRGYSDQAHLLREFRRFSGSRPQAVGFLQSSATSGT